MGETTVVVESQLKAVDHNSDKLKSWNDFKN